MSSVQAAPAYVAARPEWTTPQILKTGVAAVWISAALLMAAAILGARSHRHAMQVVGRDSAPSIVAAEHIRAALADMDSQAAKGMLGGKDAQHAFEARRTEVVSAIIAAAENITYGEAERAPIQRLALGVGTYAAQIQTARDRNSTAAWREAEQFMDSTLLPAAEELDRANRQALDAAYEAQKSNSLRAGVLLFLAAAAAGGVSIALQIFLALRVRRILNPGLLMATLAGFLFVVYTGQRFQASERDLRAAKEDAFESIHALWQARAAAYSAQTDAGRYLLDPAQRAVYTADLERKSSRISELLPRALNQMRSEGQGESGEEMVRDFNEYLHSEAQIRAQEESGHHDPAWYTGTGLTQSASIFGRFDGALGRTLDVNQKAFDIAVARGFQDTDGFEVSAPVAAFLIAALAWLGLRPRIREYSA